jgi:hypothetical protein
VHISIKFIYEHTREQFVIENENLLLGFKNSARRGSWPLGPTGKLFLAQVKENFASPWSVVLTRTQVSEAKLRPPIS